MRIKQLSGHDLVPDVARRRLEEEVFSTVEVAKRELQAFFPHHLVCEDGARLRIAVRDRSFYVAEFLEVT